jgi:hypothetical protein
MSKINADDFKIGKENKKNPLLTTIKRINLENEFVVEDVVKHLKTLKENEATLKAQSKLSTAVLNNISRNHPHVYKMKEEDIVTASYLYETKSVLKETDKKLMEVLGAIRRYKDTLKVIETKFNINVEETPAA